VEFSIGCGGLFRFCSSSQRWWFFSIVWQPFFWRSLRVKEWRLESSLPSFLWIFHLKSSLHLISEPISSIDRSNSPRTLLIYLHWVDVGSVGPYSMRGTTVNAFFFGNTGRSHPLLEHKFESCPDLAPVSFGLDRTLERGRVW